MSFFEFLPLIIILVLQFLYQFQKAAKRRAIKKRVENKQENSLEENENFISNSEDNLESINKNTSNKYATPIYQEFFENTFNIPSAISNKDEIEEEDNFNDELIKEKSEDFLSNQENSLDVLDRDMASNRVISPTPVFRVNEIKSSFKKNIVYLLKNNSKKAIVLNEILGKPKF